MEEMLAQFMESSQKIREESTADIKELKSQLGQALNYLDQRELDATVGGTSIVNEGLKEEGLVTLECSPLMEAFAQYMESQKQIREEDEALDKVLASKKENREGSAIDIREHEVQNDTYTCCITNDSVVVFEDDADSMYDNESVDEEAIEEEYPPSKYVPYYFSMTSSDEKTSEDGELFEELELASSFSMCFELMEGNDDVNDEIVDEEASEEEVPLEDLSHITLECLKHVEIETDEEIKEVVQEEESYVVELERLDFIFAPNSFELNGMVSLLEFLPKFFGVGRRSRSRKCPTTCFSLPKRTSSFLYHPRPALVREHKYVRGWSLVLLKWLWKYKGRSMFDWCFGFPLGNLRRFSCLSVLK